MQSRVRKCVYLTVGVLLGVACGAFAQDTVTYNGVGSNGFATLTDETQVYTVISTDYYDAAPASSTVYTAFNQTLGSLDAATASGTPTYNWGNTMWGSVIAASANGTYPFGSNCSSNSGCTSDPELVYEFAAYLASNMLSCTTSTCETDYQNAIWFVMDPPALTSLDTGDTATILLDAVSAVASNSSLLSTYAGVSLISPSYVQGQDPACPSQASTTQIQEGCGEPEFLAFASTPSVSTPESSEALIFAANLVGLAGLAFVFRRRMIRVKT